MAYRLGVDLGTTYTAAATLTDGVVDLVSLGNRALQVPSVLYLPTAGEMLVGEAAERRAVTDPTLVVREFKRRIGDPVPILVGGVPHSPQSLTGRLLRWVVDLTVERAGEPPEAVTVTHPANWGPFKIDLLEQAIRLADLESVELCTEPVAAALAYAHRARLEPGQRVAVFDLGGGTFDSAVLSRTSGGFELVGRPEGIEHLGGIDFDAAVLRHVTDALGDSPAVTDLTASDPAHVAALARLARDCVDAKEALSADTEATIPVNLPGLTTTVRLTRAEFEDMIRPSLDQATDALRRALRSAGTAPEQLHAVVLVGGSSRIPLVSQLLTETFGRPVVLGSHPKHDVATGAALHGGGLTATPAPAPTPTPAPAPAPAEPAPAPSPEPEAAPSEPEPAQTPAVPPEPVPEVAPTKVLPAVPDLPAALLPVGSAAGAPPPGTVPAPSSPSSPDRLGRLGRLGRTADRQRLALIAGIAVAAVVAGVALVVQLTSGSDESADSGDSAPVTGEATPSTGDTASPTDDTASPVDLPQSADPLPDDVIVASQPVKDAATRETKADTVVLISMTDGKARPITEGRLDSRPTLSTDRRTVIYTDRTGNWELRMMPADGSGSSEPLFPDDAVPDCDFPLRPAWHSPTGTLAMPCRLDVNQGTRSLRLVTLDDPETSRELDEGILGDPAFSPDGKTIAYWKGTQNTGRGAIFVLDTSDPQAEPEQLTDGDGDGDPAFSSDGGTIAFSRYVRGRGEAAVFDLYTMPATGGEPVRLTGGSGRDVDPSFSPDDAEIAFSCNRLLCSIRADGSRRRTVSRVETETPIWSAR